MSVGKSTRAQQVYSRNHYSIMVSNRFLLIPCLDYLVVLGILLDLVRAASYLLLWFDLLVTEPMGRKEEFAEAAWGFGRNKLLGRVS